MDHTEKVSKKACVLKEYSGPCNIRPLYFKTYLHFKTYLYFKIYLHLRLTLILRLTSILRPSISITTLIHCISNIIITPF